MAETDSQPDCAPEERGAIYLERVREHVALDSQSERKILLGTAALLQIMRDGQGEAFKLFMPAGLTEVASPEQAQLVNAELKQMWGAKYPGLF